MLELLFIAFYQVAAGAPADPAPPPQSQPVTQVTSSSGTQASAENDRNRRRCRVQAVTGSRLGSQVCLSQAEEDMLAEEGRNLVNDAMRMWDNQSSPGGNVVCDRPGC